MEFNENVYVTITFAIFTKLMSRVNNHYVLRNMFSKILSLNLPNFLLPMCLCNEFIKFSHCQSFPPYGMQLAHNQEFIFSLSVCTLTIIEVWMKKPLILIVLEASIQHIQPLYNLDCDKHT